MSGLTYEKTNDIYIYYFYMPLYAKGIYSISVELLTSRRFKG